MEFKKYQSLLECTFLMELNNKYSQLSNGNATIYKKFKFQAKTSQLYKY